MSQLVKKSENRVEILQFSAARLSYPVVYVRFTGYTSRLKTHELYALRM